MSIGGVRKVARNPSRLYKQHVANLRELETALGNVSRLARKAIASRDPERSLKTLLRLYAFLVGAWAECRLKKLLHEELGFSPDERAEVERSPTQLDQWCAAVDLSFRKHHHVPRAELNERTLGVAHAARRSALLDVLSNELKIVIEIRNKLAHGQWMYPFNNEGTAVEPEKFCLINQENLLSLQFKLDLAGHLADAIHDLVVSPRTFERDFEDHFKKLFQVRINLQRRSYEKYALQLQAKRAAARSARGA